VAKYQPLMCCVCLFNGAKNPNRAMTTVKGYRTCGKHLSYSEPFFRRWEAAQDPKRQPPDPVGGKSKKKPKKKG
jgi:hypothetical protein